MKMSTFGAREMPRPMSFPRRRTRPVHITYTILHLAFSSLTICFQATCIKKYTIFKKLRRTRFSCRCAGILEAPAFPLLPINFASKKPITTCAVELC